MAEENRPEQSGEEQQPDFSKRHPLEHKCVFVVAADRAGWFSPGAVSSQQDRLHTARQAAVLTGMPYWGRVYRLGSDQGRGMRAWQRQLPHAPAGACGAVQ